MRAERPTFGGLREAQRFLRQKGCPMPIFRTDIYDDKSKFLSGGRPPRWLPTEGKTVSLDSMIANSDQGPMHEVWDVALINEQGTKITFSHDMHFMLPETTSGGKKDIIIESSGISLTEKDWIAFQKIARWGKPNPNIWDWIEFHLLPWRYAARVFAA